MNREKLKRVIEGVEAAEKAIADLSKHKRELYQGASEEFDPKVLRKIVQRRRMDPAERTRGDDLLDQYEVALGMAGKAAKEAVAGNATYEKAAKDAGVSRATIARQIARTRKVSKATDGETPHDPDTGEIRETGSPPDSPAAVTSTSHKVREQAGAAAIPADDWDAINGTHPHQLRGAA